jgi:hypothetical protein
VRHFIDQGPYWHLRSTRISFVVPWLLGGQLWILGCGCWGGVWQGRSWDSQRDHYHDLYHDNGSDEHRPNPNLEREHEHKLDARR